MPMQLFQHAFHHGWLDVEAEVTDCTFIRGSAAGEAIGASLGSEVLPYYAVGFTYTVNTQTYEGETRSPDAVEPRDKFLLRYNPRHPEENNSLESEIDHSGWFQDYMYVVSALIIGVMLLDFLRRNLLHH